MKTELKFIHFTYKTLSGKEYNIPLSYQLFGQQLFSAPIILVNHALTGNSQVCGENGWWKNLIGENQAVDLQKYTILCFNIPGNGFDGNLIHDFHDFTCADIASVFLKGLDLLKINSLKAIIGGSLGGAIGWEMLALKPDLAEIFVPIACDYKTHDWLFAQCKIQEILLHQNENPLQNARMHAMLCYRTPESLNDRFKNRFNEEKKRRDSEDWLIHHGNILNQRFTPEAYRMMNHLLMKINADEEKLHQIEAEILLVSINTDLFFPASEIRMCYQDLKKKKQNVFYREIKSIHGHDAFLMEYQQLSEIIKDIFKKEKAVFTGFADLQQ